MYQNEELPEPFFVFSDVSVENISEPLKKFFNVGLQGLKYIELKVKDTWPYTYTELLFREGKLNLDNIAKDVYVSHVTGDAETGSEETFVKGHWFKLSSNNPKFIAETSHTEDIYNSSKPSLISRHLRWDMKETSPLSLVHLSTKSFENEGTVTTTLK
jgi:hypothetical protein